MNKLLYFYASQANLAIQENRLTTAMLDLQKAQEELGAKQEELDVVQAEYEKAMREKQVNCSLQKTNCHPHFKENFSQFYCYSLERMLIVFMTGVDNLS